MTDLEKLQLRVERAKRKLRDLYLTLDIRNSEHRRIMDALANIFDVLEGNDD